ncbi:hypothetical protein [Aliirhizobium smilacinae]|uniref:Uncharacterized protein n=1 Tax=Aliirhizobium smilacinae TaxID=1395944 RepID=A0A5C4XDL3_9HYPH|nr:hypothetical protein [Rhizobium smilacinae]TNM61349.1 hypothetical protein FHP24_22720 [Rhizobium smilacinae]
MTRETTSNEATRFGSSQPSVAKSSGTGEAPAKKQPSPASIEINKARKAVGADGVTEQDERVADAGDAG